MNEYYNSCVIRSGDGACTQFQPVRVAILTLLRRLSPAMRHWTIPHDVVLIHPQGGGGSCSQPRFCPSQPQQHPSGGGVLLALLANPFLEGPAQTFHFGALLDAQFFQNCVWQVIS